MSRNYSRTRTLVPWYHEQKPRCVTTTLAMERCSYSASYVAKNDDRIQACKVHADMLAEEGYVMKKIKPARINIRGEGQNINTLAGLRIVS